MLLGMYLESQKHELFFDFEALVPQLPHSDFSRICFCDGVRIENARGGLPRGASG